MSADKTRMDYPENGSRISPRRNDRRLLGSISLRRPFPHLDDDFDPPLDPPFDPPVDETVSTPDLGLQFRPCLEALSIPPDALIDALRQAFGPESDPRYECLNDIGTVGIWLRPAVSNAVAASRERGLARLDLLGDQASSGLLENFGVFMNASYIRGLARDRFDSMIKRLSADFRPDLDGPIHLTGFEVSFEPPDKMITTVSGFDDRPWPDVKFIHIITDTLTVEGIEPDCETESDTKADLDWINLLSILSIVSLGGLILAGFKNIAWGAEQLFGGGGGDDDDGDGGVGCEVARSLPRQQLLPIDAKLAFAYSNVQVTSGGVFGNGQVQLVPREAEVRITGPTQIAAKPADTSISRTYRITTSDLRPDLDVQWTADGVVVQPGSHSTSIRFSLPTLGGAESVTKRVSVTVTDADGVTASASLDVRIVGLGEDPDMPPVCLVKPWLPVCNPGGGGPGPG